MYWRNKWRDYWNRTKYCVRRRRLKDRNWIVRLISMMNRQKELIDPYNVIRSLLPLLLRRITSWGRRILRWLGVWVRKGLWLIRRLGNPSILSIEEIAVGFSSLKWASPSQNKNRIFHCWLKEEKVKKRIRVVKYYLRDLIRNKR